MLRVQRCTERSEILSRWQLLGRSVLISSDSDSDSHSTPESEDFGGTVFVLQEVVVLRGKVVKWECLTDHKKRGAEVGGVVSGSSEIC